MRVQLETDMELTELDAAKIGSNENKEGFTGFETSIVDNMPREPGPSILEKGSFAPHKEFSENKPDEHSDYLNFKASKDLALLKHEVKLDDNYNSAGVRSPEFLGRSVKDSQIAWMYGK